MVVLGFRDDTGKEVLALIVETVGIKEARMKNWEGDCLHKRIVLASNCKLNTKPASALAVASRGTKVHPQEARRLQGVK